MSMTQREQSMNFNSYDNYYYYNNYYYYSTNFQYVDEEINLFVDTLTKKKNSLIKLNSKETFKKKKKDHVISEILTSKEGNITPIQGHWLRV